MQSSRLLDSLAKKVWEGRPYFLLTDTRASWWLAEPWTPTPQAASPSESGCRQGQFAVAAQGGFWGVGPSTLNTELGPCPTHTGLQGAGCPRPAGRVHTVHAQDSDKQFRAAKDVEPKGQERPSIHCSLRLSLGGPLEQPRCSLIPFSQGSPSCAVSCAMSDFHCYFSF